MTEENALISLSARELESMARRAYQAPPLKKTAGRNPRWYIRVRKIVIDGRQTKRQQVREYLGDCATVGIREANRLRAEKLKEINGQTYALKSQVRLADFITQAYNLRHIPTLGAGTQAKYRTHLANHIIPAFGDRQLGEIGTEDIQAFLLAKEKSGLSWWTRNDLRNIISSVYTCAHEWKYFRERNPVEGSKLGRKRAKREKLILTDEQTISLLRELPADVGLIVQIADSLGMRISEILGLKWRRVDLKRGEIVVDERYYRGDTDATKTENSVRRLPLGSLAEELTHHRARLKTSEPEDYVFQHPKGGPYDDRGLNQHFLRKAAKRLGFYFVGFGFHSFRRGVITGLQEIGGSTIEVQKIAGHAKPSTTSDYTQMQLSRRRELIERRQERLRRL